MGAAVWYNGLSGDFKDLVSPVDDLRDLWGVELYYNVEITPWFHVTPDLQILQNEFDDDDTAVVVGVRGVSSTSDAVAVVPVGATGQRSVSG